MSYLIPKQFEIMLQAITQQILGIDPLTDVDAYSKVRIDWQTGGQPAWGIDEDKVFLRALEEDDPYNRVREEMLATSDAAHVQRTVTYTRVWGVYWTIYGPNSSDIARKLRTRLFDQDIHDQMAASNVYLITDIAAPRRVPELVQSRWWERVDFDARFNEAVSEEDVLPTIGSADITIAKENGLQTEVKVDQ